MSIEIVKRNRACDAARFTCDQTGDQDFDATEYLDHLHVDFIYPKRDGGRSLHVGLSDVRAADDIRITYDFARDGWKIEQEVLVADSGMSFSKEPREWREAAFIHAWQFERPV